jgi:DNA-binding IclR family transcriptional regulator
VQLSTELRETVDLAIVKRDHLVFIDQVTGSQRLRTVSAVGDSFPLYCTANGKAYLAQLDEEAVEKLVGRAYEARTPNTLRTFAALTAELKGVRKAGVAFDREEHTIGISAAGVALRDVLGNYVAISVPVPTPRFTAHQRLIAERLLATKAAIQDHLTAVAA